jgi:hypothetical protein
VVTVAVEADLADLPLGDAGVALLEEVHDCSVEPVGLPGEPTDLLLDSFSQSWRDLGVPCADRDLHPGTSCASAMSAFARERARGLLSTPIRLALPPSTDVAAARVALG